MHHAHRAARSRCRSAGSGERYRRRRRDGQRLRPRLLQVQCPPEQSEQHIFTTPVRARVSLHSCALEVLYAADASILEHLGQLIAERVTEDIEPAVSAPEVEERASEAVRGFRKKDQSRPTGEENLFGEGATIGVLAAEEAGLNCIRSAGIFRPVLKPGSLELLHLPTVNLHEPAQREPEKSQPIMFSVV